MTKRDRIIDALKRDPEAWEFYVERKVPGHKKPVRDYVLAWDGDLLVFNEAAAREYVTIIGQSDHRTRISRTFTVADLPIVAKVRNA